MNILLPYYYNMLHINSNFQTNLNNQERLKLRNFEEFAKITYITLKKITNSKHFLQLHTLQKKKK